MMSSLFHKSVQISIVAVVAMFGFLIVSLYLESDSARPIAIVGLGIGTVNVIQVIVSFLIDKKNNFEDPPRKYNE